jgi:hypothetical protein
LICAVVAAVDVDDDVLGVLATAVAVPVEDDWEGAVVVFGKLLGLFEATVDVGTAELMGVADVFAPVVLELLVLPAGIEVVDGVCTTAPDAVPLATPELAGTTVLTVLCMLAELAACGDP